MDTDSLLIIAGVLLLVLVVLFFVAMARRGAGRHGEDDSVVEAAAAAIEDVAGDIIGVDARPLIVTPPAGPADELTLIKGLGPKVAARLNELGIIRFDQIAEWDEGTIAAMDAQMGTFAGRIARDKWVEQAGYLARADKSGFEAKFGKLGG